MQKISVIPTGPFKYIQRLDYVLDFLNNHPLNPALQFCRSDNHNEGLKLIYGEGEENLCIPAQRLFFQEDDVILDQLKANKYSWEGRAVYSVETGQKEKQKFYHSGRIRFDIFETIFFHISRYEEVFCTKSDNGQAGWLKEALHFFIKNELETIPVVDHLVVALFEFLGKGTMELSSSYDISHDIDILTRFTPISKFIKSLGATVVYGRGLHQFFGSIRHYMNMLQGSAKDPYDSYDQLFRKESFWKNKSLYLMSGGNTKYDNKYKLSDKKLDEIIDLALSRGYSVGIHPSFNAGFQKAMFEEELAMLSKKLGQEVVLNRQHWLRFDWEITPYIYNDIEIQQDASMGYNSYLGFRCGTGFAYHLYDFKKEKAFTWLEQPFAFMESSAIHQANRTGVELSELMGSVLLKNKFNTHISFNFHNSNFDPLLDTGRILTDFYTNELLTLIEAN